MLDSYESCLQATLSAKLILLCANADELIETAKIELCADKWNIIRGADYFVEFLSADMSKGASALLCF